jgi:SAM-dependent methyltransferase
MVMDADARRARGPRVVDIAPGAAGFPAEAVEWLVGAGPSRLLELGAGTGELTHLLCHLGHDVIAVDPARLSLTRLSATAPQAHVVVARAEDLPIPASTVDIVVAGSSYAVTDSSQALPEIARVLRPGGVFAVLRRSGDHKVPWVRKVSALVGGTADTTVTDDPFESSDVLTLAERRTFRQWQRFDRPTLVGFVAASTKAAQLDGDDRDALLAEAGALYDSYGRGPDGLLMPWMIECLRARVKGTAAVVTADATDDGLLIDFS